jgi:hypothetical protein
VTQTATLPDSPRSRLRPWSPGQTPPPYLRRYAFPMTEDSLAIAGPDQGVLSTDDGKMYARAVITSIAMDAVGDEVVPQGCQGKGLERFRLNDPWFFGHQMIPFPVGRASQNGGALDISIIPDSHVEAGCYFHQSTPEAVQVYVGVKEGWLRGVSIGFNPLGEPIKLKQSPETPYAGFRYPQWELLEISWVGVPANPYCTVIRQHLSRGVIGGEKISPMIRKALEPLAEPLRAWSHGCTFKSKSRASKTFTVEGIMARNRKHRRQAAAKAALDESSISSGGATVPAGETGETDKDEHADILDPLHDIGKEAGEGHAIHYHPESSMVHHSYPEGEDEQKLAKMKEDIGKVPGVGEVVQEAETPEPGEEGWKEAYPNKGEVAEGDHPAEFTPASTEPAGETGEEKGLSASAVLKLLRLVPRKHHAGLVEVAPAGLAKAIVALIPKSVKDGLQDCVSHKIPKLVAEGRSQEESEAIAYSMCGEKKDFSPIPGAETETNPTGAEAPEAGDLDDETDEDVPPGVAHGQKLIEHLESNLGKQEPENKEVWEGILELLTEHYEDRYPDHDFGGEVEEPTQEEEQEEEAEGEEVTNDLLARYRSYKKLAVVRFTKRLAKRHKAVMNDATEHMEDVAQLPTDKNFPKAHRDAARYHANSMRKCLKEMDAGMGEEENTEEKWLSEAAARLDKIGERAGAVEKATFTLFGRRTTG